MWTDDGSNRTIEEPEDPVAQRRTLRLRPGPRWLIAVLILGASLWVGFACLGQTAQEAQKGAPPIESPLLGTWRFKEGAMANAQRSIIDEITLRPDGTLNWDSTHGTFMLSESEVAFSVDGGETYRYTYVLSGATLTLDRATSCGRYDHLVYTREQ